MGKFIFEGEKIIPIRLHVEADTYEEALEIANNTGVHDFDELQGDATVKLDEDNTIIEED